MSYCQLIHLYENKPSSATEFRNAWGGIARIWTPLFDAYVPKKHQYDSWLCNGGNDRRLWDLAKREDLPMFERSVHAFTFDHFYVCKENFERLASDLIAFVERHPVPGQADHLSDWAKCLRETDADAVGLYGTSVSENVWLRAKKCPHCGNSTDEDEDVPLSEGTEVYAWLESLALQPA